MIIFFEGIPGSGKTYDAVRKIVDNLKKRRKVYCNIDGMNEPECIEAMKSLTGLGDYDISQYFNVLKNDDVCRFWEIAEHGSLVVIDEVHKYFNARDWSSQQNRALADWASTHRHFGYDVVLITQKIDKVDKQVKTLVEWTYKYKKVNFVGSFVKNKYVLFSYSGESDGEALSKKIYTYDKAIFACYQSYATKDTKELGVLKTVNIFGKPIFIFLIVSIVITIILLSKSSLISGNFAGHKSIMARSNAMLHGEPKEPPISQMKIVDDKKSAESRVPGPGAQPRSGLSAPPVPLPAAIGHLEKPVEKKLLATIDGHKIYKCGEKICQEN